MLFHMKPAALIALGSNVGDSIEILSLAAERLQTFSDAPLLKSSLWRTTPVDCPPGSPPFINAAVALVPRENETSETLLAKLQELEREFGRKPKIVSNEPRPLDLDLIAFGNEIKTSAELTLPHPRAHLRKFVLRPLSEIVPHFVFPSANKDVSELLKQLQSKEVLERMSAF
jgi:2-amino-4-hydroxy-6-hydroxymethyldihydropteridine diphosphokinase